MRGRNVVYVIAKAPGLRTSKTRLTPPLPPIEELTIDSDFRGFLHPKVSEDIRRSALRKLFSDPHFNVMDGLDVYIDDYSKADPIPAEMLAGLKQAQRIVRWAQENEEKRDEPSISAEEETRALPASEANASAELPPAEAAPEVVSAHPRKGDKPA